MSAGIVKCVLSGDSIVVRGRSAPGASQSPPEKVLTLSGISAPRFSPRSTEALAFESRDYLRKKLVGKEITFRVVHQAASRDYAIVWLNGENVALGILREGWARCRPNNAAVTTGQIPPLEASLDNLSIEDQFAQAEQQAKDQKIGLWQEQVPEPRPVKQAVDGEPRDYFEAHKRTQVTGIIEQVRDGSTFRILLLPDMQMITLFLSGVKCPAFRKDVPEMEDLVEPFGEEAKVFTETRLLQREVKVVLEGVTNQAFVGSVIHPAGNIAEFLLANGLAKIVDWSMTMVTGGPQKLREAERVAKEKRLRIWKDVVVKQASASDKFEGIVTKIISGDTLCIQPIHGKDEKKITLSSIRQPKAKDPKEAYYNFEAKEFLRSRLIGKQVVVTIEYVRPPAEGFEERTCASIFLGPLNVAEGLVSKGLAGVIRHRASDEDRSRHYDNLLIAEDRAKNEKRGLFSDKEPPVLRISDASENAAKARSFLTSFQRSGKINCIVDFISNGGRFKLFIPKDNLKLSFVLAGVRCPKTGRSEAEKGEPFGKEALDFATEKCYQRNVEIEIEAVDRTGSFIGTLWFGKNENFAAELLKQGFAYVHAFSAEQSKYTSVLFEAEEQAKKSKKGVWSVYKEEEKQEIVETAPETLHITVTEVVDASHFYFQKINDDNQKFEAMMKELAIAVGVPLNHVPKTGELVAAQFSADQSWYRARVRKILPGNQVEVFYIDYGNSEELPVSSLRTLGVKFTTFPPQAHEAYLSFVRTPSLEDDYGEEALDFFKNCVNRPSMDASVDYKSGNTFYVSLIDGTSMSVNSRMLRNGFAQLSKPKSLKGKQDVIEKLSAHQSYAHSHRLGMFEYGDFSLDGDETL